MKAICDDGHHQRINAWAPILFVVMFVCLAILKSPRIFHEPRFWAEEGSRFYVHFLSAPTGDIVKFTYNGSTQVVANFLAYLAAKAPVSWAPSVMTGGALALQCGIAFQIGMLVRSGRFVLPVGILVLIGYEFLPQSYEIWLNATTAQQTCSIAVLLLLITPAAFFQRHLALAIIVTILLGSAGVPAVIAAPVFVLRAILERDWRVLVIGITLSLCAFGQLVMLLTSASTLGNRSYSANPMTLLLPFVLQSIGAPLFSVPAMNRLGRFARTELPYGGVVSALTLLAGMGIMAVAFWNATWATKRPIGQIALYVLLAGLLVTLVQLFGALGDREPFLSGWVGGRYMMFGAMSFMLLIALGASSGDRVARRTSLLVLVLICCAGILDRAFGTWFDFFLDGPGWRSQLAHCPSGPQPCRVEIWPGGGLWFVDIAPGR